MQQGFALHHIPAAKVGKEVNLGGGEFNDVEQVFINGEIVGKMAEGADGERVIAQFDLLLQGVGKLLLPTGNAVVVDPANVNVPAAWQPPPGVGLHRLGLDGDEG